MGDKNQLHWVQNNLHLIQSPILEIGSRHYDPGTAIDYRGLCQGMEFIGVDMSAGDNVDIALDLTQDMSIIEEKLGNKKFKTIICCSVLEHVNNLFKMAENITQLLEEGGVLFISVPFSWRFHGYPNDYWRFTPEGIKYLFPSFDFKIDRSSIGSINFNDTEVLPDNPNSFNSFVTKSWLKKTQPQTLKSKLKRKIKRLFFPENEQEVIGDKYPYEYPYLIVPTNINMIGIQKIFN